mgnify:CR=1 FL=1
MSKSKRLKLVSVRLKPDMQPYKKAVLATSSDVAFSMLEEISGFDENTIGVLNLNSKGEVISLNLVTLNAFEKNMADVAAASILSNCSHAILISKDGPNRDRKVELTKRFQANMQMLSIPVFDHVSGYDAMKEKELAGIEGFISYAEKQYIDRGLSHPESVFLSEAANLKNVDADQKWLKLKIDRYFQNPDPEHELTKESALNIIEHELSAMDREVVGVISLDEEERPVNVSYAAIGDLDSAAANPREIFKVPLLSGADSVILFHNHPSGHPDPSPQDKDVAKRLQYCGKILGIELTDNVIIGKNKRYSFAAYGELSDPYEIDPDTGKLKELQPEFKHAGVSAIPAHKIEIPEKKLEQDLKVDL